MDFLGALIACKKEHHWQLETEVQCVFILTFMITLQVHSVLVMNSMHIAVKQLKKDEPVFGVKGPTWLSVIPNYSVINGNVVDYMHCVLSGVNKNVAQTLVQLGVFR